MLQIICYEMYEKRYGTLMTMFALDSLSFSYRFWGKLQWFSLEYTIGNRVLLVMFGVWTLNYWQWSSDYCKAFCFLDAVSLINPFHNIQTFLLASKIFLVSCRCHCLGGGRGHNSGGGASFSLLVRGALRGALGSRGRGTAQAHAHP